MAKIYSEDQVNTTTNSDQNDPAVAALTGGGYVVVWTSLAQDAAGSYGIYAQRYTASGIPTGPEFRVNSTTAGHQLDSSVVGLSDGGFLVTWTDQSGTDGSSYGVYAQRYNASGVAQGSEFRVNSYINADQGTPSVAAYTGGFVVTWYSNGQDGSGYGVYAQRYSNAGAALGPEFRVNTTTSGSQTEPDIAANANGSFVVVWTDQSGTDGSSYGVYAQRYDSGGVAAGSQFKVNTFVTGAQYEPAVTTLVGGGFVVVWRSDGQDGSSAGVYGQRYDAGGNALGSEFRVNVATAGGQYQPDVTALANGGFVVTWYNDNTTDSGVSYADVYTREYAADGSAATGDVKANTPTPSAYYQYEPAIAHLGSDNYVVVWRSDSQDGSGSGVYQQLFGTAAELPRQGDPYLADFTGTLTFGENLVNATPQVIDTAVSFIDPDSSDFAGGRVELAFIQSGSAEDQLGVRNQGSGAGQIGVSGSNVSFNDGSGAQVIGTISGGSNGAALIVNLNASATVDAVEQLIQNLTYANSSGSPQASRTVALRVYDGDGGASEPGVVTINVTREVDGTPTAYGEEQVNTYTANHQQWPSAAKLTDGSYVVTWVSTGQDGSGDGVYAQRYANNGEAIGPEFRVNSLTGGAQDWPQITGLTTGDYVITWQDVGNDGSGYGVYGQRYNASGVAQGVQFQIHTATSGTQYHDNIAAYSSGFTGVWSTSSDIYLQRFDNTGTKIGPETLVSTVVGGGTAQSGSQYVPDAATLGNGSVVIVWSDSGSNDGGGYGVYGRIYNPVANTFGSSFLVNTTTSGNQSYAASGDFAPTVAALSDGTFVVVWPSDSNDPSGWAVMAQRFDASGNKLGGEFQVNEQTNGSQYISDVTALSSGGFVVSWYNDNYDITSTGSTSDVYIREYTNAGVAVDGERKVNSSTSSTETQPSVVDLGQGNFSVIWSGNNHEAESPNTYGIFQQLFGDTGELARSASPTLADFVGTVTFAENTVNAGLQVIDAAVGLSDPDSGNFNGGRLDLYYTQNGAVEDQLGVVHQGNGAGQIGVSGGTVSYGGTAIGTISGGVNGANLVISFTSNAATVEAVEALIQRLGYSNADSSPNSSRTLGLRVSDGDGGSSNTNSLTINITQDLDGTPTAYGEEQVNTYAANHQDAPAIATLSGGGYVVTWVSPGQDGASDGVYAQRFTASGVAVGPEFRVSTSTAGSQNEATVAGLSDGGFVVVWTDTNGLDGNSYGVYSQRYDAAGVALGGESLVNTFTGGTQYQPSVASYGGGYVVSWTSNGNVGGSGYDIYTQRFNNGGTKIGPEGRVNTTVSSTQSDSDVAARADGSHVVVWVDQGGADGNSYGVYAQRHDTVGNKLGPETLVNTETAGAQYEVAVAMLSDNGYVVVWRSDVQDGSGAGVYGQRFDSTGTKVGGEFQISETTAGNQYQPDVTGLSTGGFVVTWRNDNYDLSGTGTTEDIYIREYDASGTAVDGQRKLESPSNSTEYQPVITDLGNGNYAVAYVDYATSASGGNNTYDIVQQIFGNGAEMPRQANPVLGDLLVQRNFSYTLASPYYAGNPQVIDTDVAVSDSDSANFAGGSLIVEFLDGTAGSHANETVAIRNQGTGAGQIGVSGSDVTYGGVTIGTFSGGSAGSNLVVSLNASADAAAARALVENITYVNTVPGASQTDRYIGFRLFDGDGGASQSSDVLIRIQATVTPTTVDLQDVAPLVTLSETQAQAGVVLDSAVQLVYSGANSFNGGSLTVSYVSGSGRAEDQLSIRNEGNGAGQVGVSGSNVSYGGTVIGTINAADTGANGDQLVINFNANATDQAIERVIENLGYQTTSDGPNASRTISIVVRDSASTASTASQVVINVTPEVDGAVKLFGEQQVNTYEGNEQHVPVVAGLQGANDGSYVVVWRSYTQDGDSYGIYGQRYDAKGAAVGAEFQVNSNTLGAQVEPEVTSLANGGYVVV
ncbi:MAG: hypothetical protein JNM32_14125, partial [Dechloromonas sp.]|nr:hypothetical protein [Dechloromonas sp.]